jgi:hypothetical protein
MSRFKRKLDTTPKKADRRLSDWANYGDVFVTAPHCWHYMTDLAYIRHDAPCVELRVFYSAKSPRYTKLSLMYLGKCKCGECISNDEHQWSMGSVRHLFLCYNKHTHQQRIMAVRESTLEYIMSTTFTRIVRGEA